MQTINSSIMSPFLKMSLEERGLLNLFLTYGKNLKEKYKDDDLKNGSLLRSYGNISLDSVSDKMNDAYISGMGVWDAIMDREKNYGLQLNEIISDVLVKSLKVTKPSFKKEATTEEGAISREKWIVERLLERMWESMPEEAKREIAEEVRKMLLEKGIAPSKAMQVSSAISIGGLTAAKAVMGFNFHIVLAQVSNIVLKMLAGKGLSFAGNAALQKFAGVFFGGPIGWMIAAVLLLPTIADLINPREYDKYLPAVFLIGLKRMEEV